MNPISWSLFFALESLGNNEETAPVAMESGKFPQAFLKVRWRWCRVWGTQRWRRPKNGISETLPSGKLTWPWTMDLWKMYSLLKMGISIAMLVYWRIFNSKFPNNPNICLVCVVVATWVLWISMGACANSTSPDLWENFCGIPMWSLSVPAQWF